MYEGSECLQFQGQKEHTTTLVNHQKLLTQWHRVTSGNYDPSTTLWRKPQIFYILPLFYKGVRWCPFIKTDKAVPAPFMKVFGQVETVLHTISTLALDRGDWPPSCSGHFISRERAPTTHQSGNWVGPRNDGGYSGEETIVWALLKIKLQSPGHSECTLLHELHISIQHL